MGRHQLLMHFQAERRKKRCYNRLILFAGPLMVKRYSMSDLPTGTVTFLFTDIESSTKRWEKHPHDMGRAVARHDELMRTAIESHAGYVFKTVGDAFCAA